MQRIARRFRKTAAGTVFSVKDFLDLGNRSTVDLALLRLQRKGVIQRVGRGLYHRPRQSALVGSVPASTTTLARKIAQASGGRIAPTGTSALNALGLSSQVPAKVEYLTDTTSRTLKIGNRTISLRHASPARLALAGTLAGTMIEALRALGPEGITPAVRRQLVRQLTSKDAEMLRKATRHAPTWAVKEIHQIVDQYMNANNAGEQNTNSPVRTRSA
jgi:hypothetical protein